MKVPNQSPPVVRYTTSNLTISSQLNSDDASVGGLRNTSTSSSGNSSINSFTPSALVLELELSIAGLFKIRL
jgi:hypothetical protein